MLLFPPSFPWGLQDPWADLLAYTKHSVCQGSSRGQIWNKEALCWLYPWDTRRINANKLKYILARSCSIFSSSVCWPDGLRCYESHQRRNVTASVFLSYTYTLLIFRLSTSDEMMKRVLSATCRCIGWSGTEQLWHCFLKDGSRSDVIALLLKFHKNHTGLHILQSSSTTWQPFVARAVTWPLLLGITNSTRFPRIFFCIHEYMK